MSHPFTIVIDTREQTPFHFDGWPTQRGTLKTGDYSIVGLEDSAAIERKSLQDLIGCIGGERDRFKRELERLMAYSCRAVVIEANMDAIYRQQYRGTIHPNAVIGSIASWTTRYQVPFIFAGCYGASWTLAQLSNHFDHLQESHGHALAVPQAAG